jgi:DNA-binding LytR/AlgR family response regulator
MYKIAVCDDNKIICLEIENILLNLQKENEIELDVDIFFKGEDLEIELLSGVKYDLLILDIELDALNGIEVGKIVREKMKNDIMQIIYISAKESYAMELFDIRPLNFLVKPIDGKNLIEIVLKAMGLSGVKTCCFEFNIGKAKYRYSLDDILYFESDGRKIKIVLKNEIKEFYGKLMIISNELKGKGFYLIHNSYLVNYDKVKEQRSENVELINGEELPISRNNRNKMKEILMHHMKGDI